MARYGMALDYKNCINCKACEVGGSLSGSMSNQCDLL